MWSAAADGYIDESQDYVGRSREQFAEALRRLEELGNRRASNSADADRDAS